MQANHLTAKVLVVFSCYVLPVSYIINWNVICLLPACDKLDLNSIVSDKQVFKVNAVRICSICLILMFI